VPVSGGTTGHPASTCAPCGAQAKLGLPCAQVKCNDSCNNSRSSRQVMEQLGLMRSLRVGARLDGIERGGALGPSLGRCRRHRLGWRGGRRARRGGVGRAACRRRGGRSRCVLPARGEEEHEGEDAADVHPRSLPAGPWVRLWQPRLAQNAA
jgi:hypothetical protein